MGTFARNSMIFDLHGVLSFQYRSMSEVRYAVITTYLSSLRGGLPRFGDPKGNDKRRPEAPDIGASG